MRNVLLACLLTFGCGTDDSDAPTDVTDGGFAFAPTDAESDADDASTPVDIESAEVVDDTPPTFSALDPITLAQGTWTVVDVNDAIGDAADSDAALALSWSSQHVAIEDDGTHALLVVAPTTWFGTEIIVLTVTDTGGQTAMQNLTVTVEEVTVADPITPPDPDPGPGCGAVTFTHTAPDATAVWLSGQFNDWGSTADSAWVMTSTGAGVWSYDAELSPGAWQYKFIVDGVWIADPDNPATVDDGFGGVNSVLEVPPCD